MKKEYTAAQMELAQLAKALGHPARIAILDYLAQQNTCFFGDIHEVLPIAKATVSQHLKELKEASLIQGEVEGPKVRYCIDKEGYTRAQLLFKNFWKEQYTHIPNCC